MAVREVLAWPAPFLRKKASPVQVFDEALRQIAGDLIDTMAEREGVGLAATQIGLDLRLVVLDAFAFEGEEGRGKPSTAFVNPEVISTGGKQTGEEGCLSFPGVFVHVDRPESVRVRAQDLEGAVFEMSAEGLGFRALLHELDHLDGIVMIDHVSHFARSRALKKHRKNQAAK